MYHMLTVAHAQIMNFFLDAFFSHIPHLIHWYTLLALTKIYPNFDHFLPLTAYIRSYFASYSASKLKPSPRPAGSSVIYPLATFLTLSLSLSLAQCSPVILIQIFAFPKYSKCGFASRLFHVLCPLLTHSLHIFAQVLCCEKGLPERIIETMTNTALVPYSLLPCASAFLHSAHCYSTCIHVFLSFLYTPHWNARTLRRGCFVHCSHPSICENPKNIC